MTIKLFPHQELAIKKLKTGSILCGGVGSGKSLASIFYYYTVECGGSFVNGTQPMTKPKDLYIITTAAKRDTLDWERECIPFLISRDRSSSINNVKLVVDSWNKIGDYVSVENAFFIFDEQRVIGNGSWVKSFYKITKKNNWILLSATPGDTWLDYVPVFVANGFYKNITEFKRRHVVYNMFSKFPKVDRFLEESRLERLRNEILVQMPHIKPAKSIYITVPVKHNSAAVDNLRKNRWNDDTSRPIKNISEYVYTMRRIVNSDPSRIEAVREILNQHKKVIVFYNYNYELEELRKLKDIEGLTVAEHNGHRHDDLPTSLFWVYLVQYLSGAEGWNCITTNTIIFFSQNYSYRIMTQAAGRIDRINTPYKNLYFYTLRSSSRIDLDIAYAIANKKNFNEKGFESRK